MAIASIDRPLPWHLEWTRFDEDIGCNSLTRVIASNGRLVLTVGDGNPADKELHEWIAFAIVLAADRGSSPPPRVRFLLDQTDRRSSSQPLSTEDANAITVREIDCLDVGGDTLPPLKPKAANRRHPKYSL